MNSILCRFKMPLLSLLAIYLRVQISSEQADMFICTYKVSNRHLNSTFQHVEFSIGA